MKNRLQHEDERTGGCGSRVGRSRGAHSGLRRCHWTTACLGFAIMSCQCFVSEAPVLFLPAGDTQQCAS